MAGEARELRTNSVDFGWLGWLFGVIVGTLSIATLVRYVLVTRDLSRPVQVLLDAYHDAIGRVFGPLELLFSPLLHWLGGLAGWDVQLYPHWRHILLLALVFWLAWARAYWSVNRSKVAVGAFTGIACSLAGTLVAGTLPLGGANEVLIFVLPTAAAFLALEVMLTVTAIVPKVRFLNLFALVAFAGLAALIHFSGPSDEGAPSPGLLALCLSVILIAFGGLILGLLESFSARVEGENWLVAARRHPDFRTGVIMLGGFVGAVALFVVDAALKLAGG